MVLDDKIITLIGAFISGCISGMGLGGGMILIPILIMSGIMQKEAQLINLFCYVPVSLASTALNIKNKTLNTKIYKYIFLCGIIGAALGAMISIKLSPKLLKKIIGIFMIFLGIYEIVKKKE